MYLTHENVADKSALVQKQQRLLKLRYGSPEQASRKSQGEFLFFFFIGYREEFHIPKAL